MISMYLALLLLSILVLRVDGLELPRDDSSKEEMYLQNRFASIPSVSEAILLTPSSLVSVPGEAMHKNAPDQADPALLNNWKDDLRDLESKTNPEYCLNKEGTQKCYDQLNLIQTYNVMNLTSTAEDLNLNPIANDYVKSCFEIYQRNHISKSDQRSKRSFTETVIMLFNNTRIVEDSCRRGGDCFYNCRKRVRHFPHHCYSAVFKNDRSSEFSRWWAEVYGDIMYTFDYILYNEDFPHSLQNQFWYLIKYLKTLVVNLKNPLKIISFVNRFDSILEKLIWIDTQIRHMKTIFEAFQSHASLNEFAKKLNIKSLSLRSDDNTISDDLVASKNTVIVDSNNAPNDAVIVDSNNDTYILDSNNVPDYT